MENLQIYIPLIVCSVVSESAAVENLNPPETDAAGGTEKAKDSTAEDEQQKTAAVQKKRKKHSKWMNGLPRRASKRLARVEADPPSETSNGAREAAPDEAELNTDDATGKSKLSGKTEVNTCEDLDKQKEAPTNLPVGNPSSAQELESASDDLKQEEKIEKELNSSLNDLFTDPCIEFAIKTLTGAIPLEEVSRIHGGPVASPIIQASASASASSSSSVLPVSDIWADPCFEFAVKTLTSEIPTQDDSHFKISFDPFTKGKCL